MILPASASGVGPKRAGIQRGVIRVKVCDQMIRDVVTVSSQTPLGEVAGGEPFALPASRREKQLGGPDPSI